jgi:hypothetical protein
MLLDETFYNISFVIIKENSIIFKYYFERFCYQTLLEKISIKKFLLNVTR